ncbi:unnamed protein product [Polarella glacialis]|uniref:ABC transporter domain-containing protein n=1 Tax=Polarella glacialis TaxID=89957 RepID=A0A813GU21_POLGL|nr:unnamed protein product [Polarella glacialis]
MGVQMGMLPQGQVFVVSPLSAGGLSASTSAALGGRPAVPSRRCLRHSSSSRGEGAEAAWAQRLAGASVLAAAMVAQRHRTLKRGVVSRAAKAKGAKKTDTKKLDAVAKALAAMEQLAQADKGPQKKERPDAVTSGRPVKKVSELAGAVKAEEQSKQEPAPAASVWKPKEKEEGGREKSVPSSEVAMKSDDGEKEHAEVAPAAESGQKPELTEEAQGATEESSLKETHSPTEPEGPDENRQEIAEAQAAALPDVLALETEDTEEEEQRAEKEEKEEKEKKVEAEEKDPYALLRSSRQLITAEEVEPPRQQKRAVENAFAALGELMKSPSQQEDNYRSRGGGYGNQAPRGDLIGQWTSWKEKGAEDDADKADLEEESSSDEEEADEGQMIKRRRGEADAVNFNLDTSGIDGDISFGIKGVAVRYGSRMVLQDASWLVRTGEKVALVGANGCGKTTQLKVLTGEITPEEGSIHLSRPDIKMAVLSQGFVDDLVPERSLREELLAAVPKQEQILRDLKEVEAKLEGLAESDDQMQLIDRLTELQTEAEQYRVYGLEERMARIMKQVGFLDDDLETEVRFFSGGWKVRIGLSKIFMTAPDALLLDEPTNHLDLESVEWLETFLKEQTLPIVVVSHDREFMNRVCTRTVETVEGMTYSYKGSYTDYIKLRDEKMDSWLRKYDLQEKKVKELEVFIKENTLKQAMSNARNKKITELAKIVESPDHMDPPPQYAKRIKFRFPEPPKTNRGGGKIESLAEVRRVTHGYGEGADACLFEDASFIVRPGDKIGIVGRNGSGKSTLLRLLMGKETPSVEGGKVYKADERNTGYFTQHQADLLPSDMTAFEVVKVANEILMDDGELVEILKKFRFKGDRLNVKVASLSGGERARLAIVRMMLVPSRMLVFDEPTNHLDVPMKETLEYSLREYEGAVVVVSHDRWFLSQTCTKIVAIENGKVEHYEGDFRHYMDTNLNLRSKIERHYVPGGGRIESVPLSNDERRKKERGGLKKNKHSRMIKDKQLELQNIFLKR